eukprot:TRINITY_DN1574_c0_g1_i2.p1 TRINITY_DN1574_c0_g1~~TRINITY_DN1574_c0_g1_i2.p1  ORF type:complete len:693 (+),score=176.40 TRINITY_DN1574_c0_g1_i2:101-2179(+)
MLAAVGRLSGARVAESVRKQQRLRRWPSWWASGQQRRGFAGQDSDTEGFRRLGTSASFDKPSKGGQSSELEAQRWDRRNQDAPREQSRSGVLGQTTVIKVRSETKTASLSGWLTTRLRDSKDPVVMTTIGAKGLNQIVKAISVAHELLHEEGELLCKVNHTHTITDDGSPASYFAVTVRPVPPRGDNVWRGQAPNRVGKTSHIPTMQQMAMTAQKTGQVCTFAVAGPESTIKAMLAIAALGPHAQFSPVLVKNEEGEYTAIHLRILPPPGAPRTVFVSKFTKPAKLAGFLKYTFTAEDGPRRVRLVASADAHDAVRSMLKACEYATDYLEQDRMPVSMTSELAEDDDAISAGSFIVTLSRDTSKEATATKVTIGLGNLNPERISTQVKTGLESGKLVLLRSTLQGAVPTLEALAKLNESYPIVFYSKQKEVQYQDTPSSGVSHTDTHRVNPDRFYLEFFVERTPTPSLISIAAVGRPYVPHKTENVSASLRVHKHATLRVASFENGAPSLRIVSQATVQHQEDTSGKSTVEFTATLQNMGFEIRMQSIPTIEFVKSRRNRRDCEVLWRDKATREIRKAKEIAEILVERKGEKQWSLLAATSLESMLLILRALAQAKVRAIAQASTQQHSVHPHIDVFVPPDDPDAEQAAAAPAAPAAADDEFPLGPGETRDEEAKADDEDATKSATAQKDDW